MFWAIADRKRKLPFGDLVPVAFKAPAGRGKINYPPYVRKSFANGVNYSVDSSDYTLSLCWLVCARDKWNYYGKIDYWGFIFRSLRTWFVTLCNFFTWFRKNALLLSVLPKWCNCTIKERGCKRWWEWSTVSWWQDDFKMVKKSVGWPGEKWQDLRIRRMIWFEIEWENDRVKNHHYRMAKLMTDPKIIMKSKYVRCYVRD